MATTRAELAQLYANVTGLDYRVALGQLTAENSKAGKGTNPLGVRCGNSKGSGLETGCYRGFAVYENASDGIRGAAWLLLNGSRYGKVRQAIAGGTPADQRLAIIGSGWAAGGYNGGAGFSSAGISSAPATVGPPPITSRQPSNRLVSTEGTQTAASGGKVWTMAELFRAALGVTDDHVVTAADTAAVADWYDRALRVGPQGAPPADFIPNLRRLLKLYIGQRVGSLTQKIGNPGTESPGPSDLVQPVVGWVYDLVANAAILLTILILGYLGVRRIIG